MRHLLKSRELSNRISDVLRGAVLLNTGAGDSQSHPMMNAVQISKFVEDDCGADGWTIDGNTVIAMRYSDGMARVVKTYPLTEIKG